MRLVFLTKNVSVIRFGRIQGHLIFSALLFQLLKIIWNRNHIIHINYRNIPNFNKINRLFHFRMFGFKRRQWRKIIHSINLKNNPYVFSGRFIPI